MHPIAEIFKNALRYNVYYGAEFGYNKHILYIGNAIYIFKLTDHKKYRYHYESYSYEISHISSIHKRTVNIYSLDNKVGNTRKGKYQHYDYIESNKTPVTKYYEHPYHEIKFMKISQYFEHSKGKIKKHPKKGYIKASRKKRVIVEYDKYMNLLSRHETNMIIDVYIKINNLNKKEVLDIGQSAYDKFDWYC